MSDSGRKKILVAAWHTGSANSLAPVVRRLREEGKVEVVVIGHQPSERVFRESGIAYRTIADYGLPNISLVSMIKLLRAESPDLVLVGTSSQDKENRNVIEQVLTLVANRLGIPSLAVVDFWGNCRLRFSDIFTNEPFGFLPSVIAVLDETSLQEYLIQGIERRRLVITGNPHFDGLAQKAQRFTDADHQRIREQIGLRQELLFFFAGSIFKSEKDTFGFWDWDVLSVIAEALNGVSDEAVGLVVKLHPQTPQADRLAISD